MIEPHAGLLTKPPNDGLLYKVIPSRYFFDMLENEYLYFRRVNTYVDDVKDSAQPVNDKESYGTIPFEKHPDFKLADYYERCRSRTYACCFSTENTNYIWNNYSSGDVNAVCLVYNSKALIDEINSIFSNSTIIFEGKPFKNFFYVNYGMVEYGDVTNFISKRGGAANPTEFTYFKDESKYSEEKEFRIALAADGIYKSFILPDKKEFTFPESIIVRLNFRDAIISTVLKEILISPNHSEDFRQALIEKMQACKVDIKFVGM